MDFKPDWDTREAALDSIREHQQMVRKLQEENATLMRKGQELCSAYGHSLIVIHDLKKVVLAYKHRHESGGPFSKVRPDSCRCCACDAARTVLN